MDATYLRIDSLRLDAIVGSAIAHVLETCGGNRKRAAQVLGISRSYLYERLRAAGVSPRRPKDPSGS